MQGRSSARFTQFLVLLKLLLAHKHSQLSFVGFAFENILSFTDAGNNWRQSVPSRLVVVCVVGSL